MKSPMVGFDIKIFRADGIVILRLVGQLLEVICFFEVFDDYLFQNYDMDLRVMMMISGLWELHLDWSDFQNYSMSLQSS